VAQAVECLLCKHKALTSNTSPPAQKKEKIKKSSWADGSSVLPSKHKALNSSPSTTKKKERGEREREKKGGREGGRQGRRKKGWKSCLL
jgi:hypothetical protein